MKISFITVYAAGLGWRLTITARASMVATLIPVEMVTGLTADVENRAFRNTRVATQVPVTSAVQLLVVNSVALSVIWAFAYRIVFDTTWT